MDTQTTDTRLADYIRPLTARKWLILIAVVLATGGVYAYYAHKPNVYTASTLVYVLDPGDPVTGQLNQQATDRQVHDQATLLDSRATAALVAGQIKYRGSAADLLSAVSITSQAGEDFVQVTAQAGTGNLAAKIANGFGNELVSLVNTAQNQRIASALRLSSAELANLGRGPTSAAGRADLTATVERLQLAQRVPQPIGKLVQDALPPASPSSPKPVRDALFALALSLALAIGVAYGAERFDRRLKDPEEMERAYAHPLLAVLPHAGDPVAAHGEEAALSSDFREPFRVLRTNLELASLDSPARTIVVTSAMPGEGKSTVVRNLALALREAGKRVAVVGLDLRHPSLARMFNVHSDRGLTDVLRGDAKLSDIEIDIPVSVPSFVELFRLKAAADRPESNGHSGNNGTVQASSGLALVLGGERPANPPAVMASERLAEVLDELRERYDVVVIDSAPLLAVTDTVPLVRYADATLLVGRLGVTTRDTARRLMEFVARVPGISLRGIVANDLARLDAEAYGYGYGYGVYADEPSTAKAPKSKRSKRKADEQSKLTV